ncbi:hypothetical protein ASE36_11170 [Rhizobium sp. Root274]|uniref:hypothetical protein n=1 Tax=unclassified Rhizobium TaxID=2613769 RepID=UPI00071439DB|nr:MULTISPECIES: hypothetical protein [unclassified Rhizobium]KQW29031.1 hypothetical protein ASC71_11190 [Rhizobium sp. Root1240]KRD29227.1 hypothetical protein ASE36_11170 [Rhizobium sp. Root274]
MTPALQNDLTTELRDLLTELHQAPEHFQTWDAHLELIAAGGLVVLKSKRAKGLVDRLFWGRAPKTTENKQLPEATAFAAIDRFLGLGAHLALSDALPEGLVLDEGFPHCAVKFAYRKKGAPEARSLSMIFIGFNDEADAMAYAERAGETLPLVATRPLRGAKLHEWR